MKTKILVGVLLFLIVLNLAVLGTWLYLRFVVPPEGPMPMIGGPPPGMRDLDMETREKLHSVMMEFRTGIMPIQNEIQRAEDSVATLLQNDPVPTDVIRRTLQRIADLRASISQKAVDQLIKTKEFLTPDQQHAFFRAIIEAQPRMRGGEGFGRGMGMGPGMRQGPPFGRFGPPIERDSQPPR